MLVPDLIFETLLLLSRVSLPLLPTRFWAFWNPHHHRLVHDYKLPPWIDYLIPEEIIPEITLEDDLLFQVSWIYDGDKKIFTYNPEEISQLHTVHPKGDYEIDFFKGSRYDFTECYYASGRLRSRYGSHRAIEVFSDSDERKPKRIIKIVAGELVEEVY